MASAKRREEVVMIVDDEAAIREVVSASLERHGFRVVTAGSAEEALARIEEVVPDLLLADFCMPGMDGMELLRRMRERDPNVAMVMFTGHATVAGAVEAMRVGAFDYIEKPFRIDRLIETVEAALSRQSSEREALHPQSPADDRALAGLLIGECDRMKDVLRTIRRVGESASTTVLIHGETGTGKELAARAIHLASPRREQAFVEVNCAALTETLLEAELFGYEKGAFTGAASTGKPGLFELADHGTIFLDEIGEMSPVLQAKLLRVLQEKRYKRVGGVKDIEVDVRIVASTNRDLIRMVEEDRFRADLYFRLAVVVIEMPPLRERGDDIDRIAGHFLAAFNAEFAKAVPAIGDAAMERLRLYAWPGNVRELRNVIERAVLMSDGDALGPSDLAFGMGRRVVAHRRVEFDLDDLSIAGMEKQLIAKVLRQTSWRRQEAAAILGINRTTLYNKIKEYDLEPAGAAAVA